MDYQIGRSTFPPICCDCLGPDSQRFAFQRRLGPAFGLAVPLCKRCARRWSRRKGLGALFGFIVVATIGIPATLILKVDEVVFWFAVFVFGTVLPVVGAMVNGWRMAPVRVKNVDISRGVVRIWFRNEHYLNDVVANQDVRR